MIPRNCEIVFFFTKKSNQEYQDFIRVRKLNLTLAGISLKFNVVFTVSSFFGNPVCKNM